MTGYFTQWRHDRITRGNYMSVLVAISLTTGILSGIWGWVAATLGLLSWVGFLGCTSYFASTDRRDKRVRY